MQCEKNAPPSPVIAWKFVGPVTSNTKPGTGCSPSSQIPLPLISWNLKIFTYPHGNVVVVDDVVVDVVVDVDVVVVVVVGGTQQQRFGGVVVVVVVVG